MYQVINQTDEEKFKMYMDNCSKEDLAKMLIEANKHIIPTSIYYKETNEREFHAVGGNWREDEGDIDRNHEGTIKHFQD